MKRKAALLALLLLLPLPLCSCGSSRAAVSGGGSETAVLESAISALLSADEDGYLSAFPPQMAKDYEEQNVCRYYFGCADTGEWLESVREAYLENYGSGVSVKGRLVSVTEKDAEALGDLNLDYYTYERYVTAENTERAIEATLEYEIKGKNHGESKKAHIYFVRQGGKWYLHPCLAFFTF